MRRFKQFYEGRAGSNKWAQPVKPKIKTKPLPKNVTLGNVVHDNYSDADELPKLTGSEKSFWGRYINKMDDWISGGETGMDAAPYLLKHKDRIPAKFRKGGEFYRGISFDDYGEFAKLLQIVKKGVLPKQYKIASWTTKLSVAKEFAEGEESIGFVIKMKIPSSKVILNMRDFVLDRNTVEIGATVTSDYFSGMTLTKKEYEVLVESFDIKLSDKNVVYVHYDNAKIKKYSLLYDFIIKWRQHN